MPASDQGIAHPRYTLVPRTLIFLTHGDTVLLLKGALHKRLWAKLYNGIGGHVAQGEDILSSAARELREETGLECKDLRLCGIITVDTGQNPGVCIFILRGESPSGDPLPSTEGTLEWVPLTKISQLPLVEDLYQLLPRLLTMNPHDPPFSGHYWYDEKGNMVYKLPAVLPSP